ncbi:MAG: hypothetical protein ACR2M0_14605 [Chloroflexia bacterium]
MDNELHDFEQFMKRREDAAREYVRGDADPLGRIVTRVSPATFFGPQGGYRQGADEVWVTYEHDAALFEPGGDGNFEILQMAASEVWPTGSVSRGQPLECARFRSTCA